MACDTPLFCHQEWEGRLSAFIARSQETCLMEYAHYPSRQRNGLPRIAFFGFRLYQHDLPTQSSGMISLIP